MGGMRATLVCVLCCQLVEEGERLSLGLLQFLATFLALPGHLLPARVCPACHSSTASCRRFHLQCRQAARKVARTSVCAAMVLGRAPEEQRLVREALARAAPPMETPQAYSQASPDRRLLARAAREWGDPGLVEREVRVRVAREERRVAEVAMGGRRKEKSRWVCTIKEEEEEEEEEESEVEMFPSVGPYQCEICQEMTDTKQMFVDHIRRLHRGEVDTQVLRSLESDLRKKERREERNLAKDEPVIKRKKLSHDEKRKKVKRKKTKHSKSDSEEEYVPKKRKASMAKEERRSKAEVEGRSKLEVKRGSKVEVESASRAEVEEGSWEQEKEELDPPTVPSGYSVASLLGPGCSTTANTSSTSITITSSTINSSSTSCTTTSSSTKKASSTKNTPFDTTSTDSATDTTYNYKASITKRYEAELNGGEEVKASKQKESTEASGSRASVEACKPRENVKDLKPRKNEEASTTREKVETMKPSVSLEPEARGQARPPGSPRAHRAPRSQAGPGRPGATSAFTRPREPGKPPTHLVSRSREPGRPPSPSPSPSLAPDPGPTPHHSRDPLNLQRAAFEPLHLQRPSFDPLHLQRSLDPLHLQRTSFDRLTAEMAALHGAAGSNTPWREMHDTFFGP